MPKKLSVLYSHKLFNPTFWYFYTDISAISVTLCNSGHCIKYIDFVEAKLMEMHKTYEKFQLYLHYTPKLSINNFWFGIYPISDVETLRGKNQRRTWGLSGKKRQVVTFTIGTWESNNREAFWQKRKRSTVLKDQD